MTEDALDDLERDIDIAALQAQRLADANHLERLELEVRRTKSLRWLAGRECRHWAGLLSRSRRHPRLCQEIDAWLSDARLRFARADVAFLEASAEAVQWLDRLAESEGRPE